MPKNKHHFVSRFYLRAFQSAEDRINILGVDQPRQVNDASLRDQCYERKLYGKTNEVEDALADLETQAGLVFKSILRDERLPASGTPEYATLLAFVAFQMLRTKSVADDVNTMVDKTTKQVHCDDPSVDQGELESATFGFDNSVLLALASAPLMVAAIADLEALLVVSCNDRAFITSDHPAFRYNQYCEKVDYQGTCGGIAKGLQIFLPLSPRLCLVLYDKSVYNVPRADRSKRKTIASSLDMDSINGIQMVSAQENVYFDDWRHLDSLQQLLSQVSGLRICDPIVVQEYGLDSDPARSLLITFVRTPDLNLALSFFRIRWKAQRIGLHARAQLVRKDLPMPPLPDIPDHYRGPATFSKFKGRR